MKKSRYTKEQIAGVLKESEAGLDRVELHRKHGISKQTFCRLRTHAREMLAIAVDTSLPALRVVRALERLRLERGLPERIVIDHGTGFTSKVFEQWAYEN